MGPATPSRRCPEPAGGCTPGSPGGGLEVPVVTARQAHAVWSPRPPITTDSRSLLICRHSEQSPDGLSELAPRLLTRWTQPQPSPPLPRPGAGPRGRRAGQRTGSLRGPPSWDAVAGSRGMSRCGDSTHPRAPVGARHWARLLSALVPLLPGWYQHCLPVAARSLRPPRQHGRQGQGHVATNPWPAGAPGPGGEAGEAGTGQAWGAGVCRGPLAVLRRLPALQVAACLGLATAAFTQAGSRAGGTELDVAPRTPRSTTARVAADGAPGVAVCPLPPPFGRRCLAAFPQIAVCLGDGGVSTRSGQCPGRGPGTLHILLCARGRQGRGPVSACRLTRSAQSGGRALRGRFPSRTRASGSGCGATVRGHRPGPATGSGRRGWGARGPGFRARKSQREAKPRVRPAPGERLCQDSHSKLDRGTKSAARLSHATRGARGRSCRLRGGLPRAAGTSSRLAVTPAAPSGPVRSHSHRAAAALSRAAVAGSAGAPRRPGLVRA